MSEIALKRLTGIKASVDVGSAEVGLGMCGVCVKSNFLQIFLNCIKLAKESPKKVAIKVVEM